jgi:hypothetical protein
LTGRTEPCSTYRSGGKGGKIVESIIVNVIRLAVILLIIYCGLVYLVTFRSLIKQLFAKNRPQENKLWITLAYLLSPVTITVIVLKEILDAVSPVLELLGIGLACMGALIFGPLILIIYFIYIGMRYISSLGDRILQESLKYVK